MGHPCIERSARLPQQVLGDVVTEAMDRETGLIFVDMRFDCLPLEDDPDGFDLQPVTTIQVLDEVESRIGLARAD